jgi:alkyl sulfatase BDS1-like metallo-beta-lactamase superfamily hydrolase
MSLSTNANGDSQSGLTAGPERSVETDGHPGPNTHGSKPATQATIAHHAAAQQNELLSDTQDLENANRGFIATLPSMNIKRKMGGTSWDLTSYKFLDSDNVPDTVHPGLWRMAKLNLINGLFKVVDRVYQVRGFDLSNMTIIEGDTGLIIIDPLINEEVAKAALNLYNQHRPGKSVVAVIYTHRYN